MQLDAHIQAIQADLAATAGLGDEAAAEAARRLSEALASTLHLRLLALLGEAALGVGAQPAPPRPPGVGDADALFRPPGERLPPVQAPEWPCPGHHVRRASHAGRARAARTGGPGRCRECGGPGRREG